MILEVANILRNKYILERIKYAESINKKINGRCEFKNISFLDNSDKYIIVFSYELFEMEIYIDKAKLNNSQN